MNNFQLHDWELVDINFDWKPARVTIKLKDLAFTERTLIAERVHELQVPKTNSWGPSVYVNKVLEIEASSKNLQYLQIEMQSGDVIRVVAEQVLIS